MYEIVKIAQKWLKLVQKMLKLARKPPPPQQHHRFPSSRNTFNSIKSALEIG